jgi:protein-tyrosine phosphatase
MIYYLFNWVNTLNNIAPVLISKLYHRDFDKRRPSYYNMSSIYSPIAFLSNASHIIDNIYLGSSYNASDRILLNNYNIKSIINTTGNIPNFYEDEEINYFNISINDNGEEVYTKAQLDASYDFICSNNQNNNILIHCVFGRSRSVTILLYYLIKKYNYTIEESLEIIKDKRYSINPSITFINNLQEHL